MSSAHPDLTVIIVSHGHEEMIAACVASLPPALQDINVELLVVDNLNSGKLSGILEGCSSSFRLYDNPSPRGFAYNINRAVAESRGDNLLILNPDTRWSQGRIVDALDLLRHDNRIGMIGCRLLNPDGTTQQSYRRFPSIGVPIARGLGVEHWPWRPRFYRERMMENTQYDHSHHEVDWLFGAWLLLKRQIFDEVGGMDESFRLYYEDVDLSYRLRQRGYKIYFMPSISFYHDHQRISAKLIFSKFRWWHVQSMARFFIKHRYLFRASLPNRARASPGLENDNA